MRGGWQLDVSATQDSGGYTASGEVPEAEAIPVGSERALQREAESLIKHLDVGEDWTRRIQVGVAHHIMEFYHARGALDDAPDDASRSSSTSPGGWMDVIQSFMHSRRCCGWRAWSRAAPHSCRAFLMRPRRCRRRSPPSCSTGHSSNRVLETPT